MLKYKLIPACAWVLGASSWIAPAVALKSSDGAAALPLLRTALARASLVARETASLARLLDLPDLWGERSAALWPVAVEDDHVSQGRRLARVVRKKLNNVAGPIASVRDAFGQFGVGCILSDLGDVATDGFVLFEPDVAPMVVANVRARGGLVTALRMTLAHELGHALFDHPMKGGGAIVEMESARGQAIEKRANVFAAAFLAPPASVKAELERMGWISKADVTRGQLRALSRYFGMGVEALAGHLVSCGVWTQSQMYRYRDLRSDQLVSDDNAEWARPTPSEAVVPIERRGTLLTLACQAIESDMISFARFCEVLQIGWPEADRLLAERELVRPSESVVGPS